MFCSESLNSMMIPPEKSKYNRHLIKIIKEILTTSKKNQKFQDILLKDK